MFFNHPAMNEKNFWKMALVGCAWLLSTVISGQARAAVSTEKEWTFLLFLNGHNNLDSFGSYNLNQMEEVGSNQNLNMVVQWASLENQDTRRLLVQKDNDKTKVTSPVIETLAPVDMGDYHKLVEFIEWGVKNYPARHYMVAVWNHGSGWHLMNTNFQTRDISYDDNTGNHITTEQLGLAMAEAAKIIGHKVDVYASDACLMAMAEVAAEMKDSVSYFAGSEDLEPGYGWPYNTWMSRWAARPQASAAEVATALSEEYLKAYNGGIYGKQSVTFSAWDLSKMDSFFSSVKGLRTALLGSDATELKTVKDLADKSLSFFYDDYKDLLSFATGLSSAKLNISSKVITDVKTSVNEMVISGGGTGNFKAATGVSVWLPMNKGQVDSYGGRYSQLEFNRATQWMDFISAVAGSPAIFSAAP